MDEVKYIARLQRIKRDFKKIVDDIKTTDLRNNTKILDEIDEINAISVEI
jgi:hypothetical protein